MRARVLGAVGVGLLLAARSATAQDTTVVRTDTLTVTVNPPSCGFCPHAFAPAALVQTVLINAGVNRFDAWGLKADWARVTPETWKSNLRLGWTWDEDDFRPNMLEHPYNGAAYYNAARSNGLSYWAGVPVTALGSATWEYFGETNRPSINDIINTTLGGVALGEMFHRVAETIRDNQATGGNRLLREVVALPLDPVGSVNRFFLGEWWRKAPNPVEHNPVAMIVRTGGGAGIVRAPGSGLKGADWSSILFADVVYGDPYIDKATKPFDSFTLRLLAAPGHGNVTLLRGEGRLLGTELGAENKWHRHQFELNQRFEYLNNDAYRFGGQTLELGLSSRMHMSGKFWLRTLMGGDAIVLAGIDAPNAGTGTRKYDFGPGAGGTFKLAIEHNEVPYVTLQFQPAIVRSISGADATHVTSQGLIEATLPLFHWMGIVVQSTYYTRSSSYADGTRNQKSFPEMRIFGVLRSAHRPAQ
jgi:hypothetical protein